MKKGIKRIAGIVALTAVLTVTQNAYTQSLVPYTNEDLENTSAFVTTLEEIEETKEVEFSNPELISRISNFYKKQLTLNDIKKIKTLEIKFEMEGSDFSDLKYFTNLEELTIYGNNVDASQLEYNQNLTDLKLVSCNVTNTNHLPNTIRSLTIFDSIILDDVLYLPYNIGLVSIYESGFSRIQPKNLSELFYFGLESSICSADLGFLESAPRLIKVAIKKCPNITGADALLSLDSKCEIELDDYAPIWLNNEIYKNLENVTVEEGIDLNYETKYLDILADELIPDRNIDDETKLQIIVNYLAQTLNYNNDVMNEGTEKDEIAQELNAYPIRYGIDTKSDLKAVCINYACLFQGLANRVGLDSKQIMSIDHTWNIVNNQKVDPTTLDNAKFMFEGDGHQYTLEEILELGKELPDYAYYVPNYDEKYYKPEYMIIEPTEIDENIGYYQAPKKTRLEKSLQVTTNLLVSTAFIYLLALIANAYDYLRYHRREEEIKAEIEQLMKK